MKINTQKSINIINDTPIGIVHGDYFFENILINKEKEVIGLIDFGDAYYGHLLNDIVIGVMEASVIDNGIFNLDLF